MPSSSPAPPRPASSFGWEWNRRRPTRSRARWRRASLLATRLLLVVLAAALAAHPVAADPVPPHHLPSGRVVRVVDGDTVDVRLGARVERVRLIAIDAPEAHDSTKLDRDARRSHRSKAVIEAMGRRATEFTAHRLDERTVG